MKQVGTYYRALHLYMESSSGHQVEEAIQNPNMFSHPVHQANENSLFGGLSREEFYTKHEVVHHESFMLNSQNMKIFTQIWRPVGDVDDAGLRGVVGLIHGYANDSSWLLQLTAVAMAKLGFFVCALDLRGHGLSEGVRGHVPDINPIVDDCVQYFDSVRSKCPNLPAFLYGESLGGAIAMLVCLRGQSTRTWAGLILSGSMCGVSTKFRPVWPLEMLLPLVAAFFSSWQLVMTKPLAGRSLKEEWKRRLSSLNPNRPECRKPTAATALEFLRVCQEVRRRSKELKTPLLVVHGGDDTICDVESAAAVYDTAGSKDKTLRVMPGMWHQLIGESKEGVDMAFGTIFSWLMVRADSTY